MESVAIDAYGIFRRRLRQQFVDQERGQVTVRVDGRLGTALEVRPESRGQLAVLEGSLLDEGREEPRLEVIGAQLPDGVADSWRRDPRLRRRGGSNGVIDADFGLVGCDYRSAQSRRGRRPHRRWRRRSRSVGLTSLQGYLVAGETAFH